MKHLLLTNDDGITARGLQSLQRCFENHDYKVSIVAPLLEMSAVSHGITTNRPIRMQQMHTESKHGVFAGIEGTPADCVKMALQYLLKDDLPDMIISGINQGANTGFNILYSGTVAAAFEGLFEGIPSLAVSCSSFYWKDYDPFFPVIRKITEWWVKEKNVEYLLNLNFPPSDRIKGIKIVKQGLTRFKEKLKEQEDPRGRTFFWLDGELIVDADDNTEDVNLCRNYATLCPLTYDMTYHKVIDDLKRIWE